MAPLCALAARSPEGIPRAQLVEIMGLLGVLLARPSTGFDHRASALGALPRGVDSAVQRGRSGTLSPRGGTWREWTDLRDTAAENVRRLMEHGGVEALLDHTQWCVEALLVERDAAAAAAEEDEGPFGDNDEDSLAAEGDPFGDEEEGDAATGGARAEAGSGSARERADARELALCMLRVLSVGGDTFPPLLTRLSLPLALRPLLSLLLVAAGGTIRSSVNELGDSEASLELGRRPVDSDLAAHLLKVVLPTLERNPLAFPALGTTGLFELLLLLMCTIAESDGAGAEHSGICVLACAVLQLCHRWRFADQSALGGGVGAGAEATLITPPSYLAFFLPFELVELLDGNSVKFARIFCAQVRAPTA